MDAAAEVPQGQGADPIPSSPRVDRKRRRRTVPLAGPVSKVLGYDNLLIEILVRLPPKPSSLPRASMVCKRWGSILSDPQFLKRFLKHHRKPPLLGFFRGYAKNFIPAMDSPDRIPAARFSLPKSSIPYHTDEAYMGCRHGLSLLINMHKRETVVWDPLTGEERIVAFPPGFNSTLMWSYSGWHGTVLCVNAEDGHVHGDCFSSPFKLVLVCAEYNTPAVCSVYDSASDVRKSSCDGVFEWVLLQKTIPLEGMVPRRMDSALFVGYDEDANVIVLTTITGNFTLQVDSMQIKHIVKRNNICLDTFYPYRNFYTAGKGVGRNFEQTRSANMLSWSNNIGIKS
ncbi:putative F-box/kelch-repeat protein At3g17540 [Aegilops tauschii subsp. strangulata]|uniref:putative F-box/kelch-repeat protein At3g17540 n=1 Tax=Aegilops tauschii subsp. strangulata TaxID=200361 RepID=UPI003CC8C6B6